MNHLFRTITLGIAGWGLAVALSLTSPANAQNIPESSDPI